MIQIATGEKNRVDKVLQDANVKLSDTLSDIFGVSGQLMREHHRTMFRYSLDHLRFLEEQLIGIDERIRKTISESGYQTQWELLQTLPGVQSATAAVVPAEVGPRS